LGIERGGKGGEAKNRKGGGIGRGGRARLGYLSRGLRVPSYATDYYNSVLYIIIN